MNTRSTAATVLFVAWLAYMLSFIGRLSWSVLMPLARDDLHFSAAQAGSYASAFYLGYIALQMPAGYLSDRIGYRRVLLAAFLTIGPFVALMSQVHSYPLGLFFMLMAGVGSGGVFSSGVKAVTSWYEEEKRVTSLSMFQLGAPMGVLVTNLALPWLATQYGWRTAMVASGSTALVGFVVALFVLKPAPVAAAPKQRTDPKVVFRYLASRRNLQLLLLAGFCSQWAQTGFNTWAITFFVKVKHLSLIHAGFMYVLVAAAPLVWIPIQGRIGDALGHARKWLLAGCLLVLAVMISQFSTADGALLIGLFGIIGALAHGALPMLTSFIPANVPKAELGLATGVTYAVWQLGAFTAPIVMGAVLDASDNNFAPVFGVAAAGAAVSALIVVWLRRGAEEASDEAAPAGASAAHAR